MRPTTYEIVFAGEAVPAILAAFEEFEAVSEGGSTRLRGEVVDQAALYGALERLRNLNLQLLEVRAVTPPEFSPTR